MCERVTNIFENYPGNDLKKIVRKAFYFEAPHRMLCEDIVDSQTSSQKKGNNSSPPAFADYPFDPRSIRADQLQHVQEEQCETRGRFQPGRDSRAEP